MLILIIQLIKIAIKHQLDWKFFSSNLCDYSNTLIILLIYIYIYIYIYKRQKQKTSINWLVMVIQFLCNITKWQSTIIVCHKLTFSNIKQIRISKIKFRNLPKKKKKKKKKNSDLKKKKKKKKIMTLLQLRELTINSQVHLKPLKFNQNLSKKSSNFSLLFFGWYYLNHTSQYLIKSIKLQICSVKYIFSF